MKGEKKRNMTFCTGTERIALGIRSEITSWVTTLSLRVSRPRPCKRRNQNSHPKKKQNRAVAGLTKPEQTENQEWKQDQDGSPAAPTPGRLTDPRAPARGSRRCQQPSTHQINRPLNPHLQIQITSGLVRRRGG
jgi:hypothetical protein